MAGRNVSATAYPAAGYTTPILALASLGGRQAQSGHRENEDALIFPAKGLVYNDSLKSSQ